MKEKFPASDCAASANDYTVTPEKIGRFTRHLRSMIDNLDSNHRFAVHQRIDQSWYMQKEAELLLLQSQLTDATKNLNAVYARIQRHYAPVFRTWYHDMRWLKQHGNAQPPAANNSRDLHFPVNNDQ